MPRQGEQMQTLWRDDPRHSYNLFVGRQALLPKASASWTDVRNSSIAKRLMTDVGNVCLQTRKIAIALLVGLQYCDYLYY